MHFHVHYAPWKHCPLGSNDNEIVWNVENHRHENGLEMFIKIGFNDKIVVYRLNHSICSENQIYLKITSSWFHLFLLPSQYTFFFVGIFCFEFQNEWKSSKQYIKWLDLHPNIFVKQTIGMIICVAKMMWLCAGVCFWVSECVCVRGVLVKMQMSISICLRLVLQFPLKMDFHKGICHLTAIFLHRVKMQTHSFIYVELIWVRWRREIDWFVQIDEPNA